MKIGNEWYHCDLLGLSGYIRKDSENRFEFVKELNTSSFLVKDLDFFAKHIPADPMWQLSNYPIPLDTLTTKGKYSKMDTNGKWFDYETNINEYIKLTEKEKQLLFAENAFSYNRNNSNAIVINYFNAAVDLINNWNNDRNKLSKAKVYLEKSKAHVAHAKNGVEALKEEIDAALIMINNISPRKRQ